MAMFEISKPRFIGWVSCSGSLLGLLRVYVRGGVYVVVLQTISVTTARLILLPPGGLMIARLLGLAAASSLAENEAEAEAEAGHFCASVLVTS